jgi:hypothetical protein
MQLKNEASQFDYIAVHISEAKLQLNHRVSKLLETLERLHNSFRMTKGCDFTPNAVRNLHCIVRVLPSDFVLCGTCR